MIYKGEHLLIHLVRSTTKEEKITQFDVNTHETVFVYNQSMVQNVFKKKSNVFKKNLFIDSNIWKK